MNKVLITGEDLTLDEIVSVCRGNAQVEISQEAREKGHEIVRRAEERAATMLQVTNEYTEDALRRTEEAVAEAYDEIKKSRARFRSAAASAGSSAAPRPNIDIQTEDAT